MLEVAFEKEGGHWNVDKILLYPFLVLLFFFFFSLLVVPLNMPVLAVPRAQWLSTAGADQSCHSRLGEGSWRSLGRLCSAALTLSGMEVANPPPLPLSVPGGARQLQSELALLLAGSEL